MFFATAAAGPRSVISSGPAGASVAGAAAGAAFAQSHINISEPTRRTTISFCGLWVKKKIGG
ncbi:hypothetical protein, partial [Streptomyces venezuelae]|uniref:hypothetical protein n=1 Tax=Streptomyces venezuelae TaxID=54571 RepID=UPI00278BB21D